MDELTHIVWGDYIIKRLMVQCTSLWEASSQTVFLCKSSGGHHGTSQWPKGFGNSRGDNSCKDLAEKGCEGKSKKTMTWCSGCAFAWLGRPRRCTRPSAERRNTWRRRLVEGNQVSVFFFLSHLPPTRQKKSKIPLTDGLHLNKRMFFF